MDNDKAFERLFARIDALQDQIQKLCDEQKELKGQFNTHLLIAKELNQYKSEQKQIFLAEEELRRELRNTKWKRAVGIITLVLSILSVSTYYLTNR
jgi:hypothetical protein